MKVIKWNGMYIKQINLIDYEITVGSQKEAMTFDDDNHAKACLDWFALDSAEVCDV
jgi:hypothetical protein